jgi:hypothetical protein
MKAFLCSCVAALVAGSPFHTAHAQRTKVPPGIALIRRLYADYACEAVLDFCDPAHELLDQPRRVLERYFDSTLARLWVADRACETRTHEICKIDFLPMWASQDPTGTMVGVVAGKDSTEVRVELRNFGAPEPRVLLYSLTRTPSGWRIHDITSEKEWSLRALLSGKD